MKKKWQCTVCGEEFLSKKKLITHLEEEISMAHEEAMNAEDDAMEAREQLNELLKKVKK